MKRYDVTWMDPAWDKANPGVKPFYIYDLPLAEAEHWLVEAMQHSSPGSTITIGIKERG